MNLIKKKWLILIAVLTLILAGCGTQVSVVEVPEPSEPVVSNNLRYEAPERTKAPEVQEGATGIG